MILGHNRRPSEWDKLLSLAFELIDQATQNSGGQAIPWSFGGGTALMLQIGHRESHDIDLFLDDPQFLGYFSPEKSDFELSIAPDDYGGDSARFQKFSFRHIGEIDFIVSKHLTGNPHILRQIGGRPVCLETVPEIIAKKVWYRGGHATSRDIFDIAAAERSCRGEVVAALSAYLAQVKATIGRLDRLNPQFVLETIGQLMIKPAYTAMAPSSLDIARDLLIEALNR